MNSPGKARPDTALRRIADLFFGVLLALVTLPIVILVAAAVAVSSRGPVFFVQTRVGRGGAHFEIIKFRTMVANAPDMGPTISGAADSRVTRVGRLLRRTRLDEVPQLWNVLRGEMTLVGPRPEVPEMIPFYTDEERTILDHRPGIIGPGQIFFATEQAHLLDEAEDAESFYVDHVLHPKLAVDLQYLRERTFGGDLVVAWKTLGYALRSLLGRS